MLPSNGAGSRQAAASFLVLWPEDRCSEEKNGTDLIFSIELFVYYSSSFCVLLVRLFFAIVV